MIPVNAAAMASYTLPSPPPYRMPRVPTMFSLATRPVMEATVACQLPQPRGMKIQAMALPILARMELLIWSSVSIWKVPSTQPK